MSNRRLRLIRFGAPLIGGVIAFLLMFEVWPLVSRTIWPATRFYEIHWIKVSDSVHGDPIPVDISRHIKSGFPGRYNTTVRAVGRAAPICNGGKSVPYVPSDQMVVTETLAYWTAGAEPPCMSRMVPGSYTLTACVWVDDLPDAQCKTSKIFTVHPRSGS